ncbi:Tetratricopeptide repeat protein 16 [Geranomyces michiganensis]|nr:Tetratricopeptide repeat protein 16 [Geranomyces michiganensis]
MAEPKTPYRPQTTPLVRPGVQLVEDQAQDDARGLAESGDPAAAIASFSRAIHLLPDEPSFYWHRAEAYVKVLDFESAIANFRQHGALVNTLRTTTAWERSLLVRPLTADSGSFDYPHGSRYVMERRLAPVAYTWGQCLLDQKRFHEALKMFEYAGSLGMKMESILLRWWGLGLYETALEILYQLTEENEGNIELFILRAKIFKHLGNVESTHLDVQRSIQINPDHPELPDLLEFTLTTAVQYKNRASYQILQGSPIMAIQCLTHALDLDPDDWILYLKRGALLADIAQYDGAIQDLERVLQQPDLSHITAQDVRDKLAEVHVQIGLEAYQQHDLVAAVNSFTTALDYQPQDPGTWKKRGDCYLALRNLPNSIADFAKAVELNPNDIKCRERCALLWATIADKLLADGEWTLSIEIWTTAINYNGTVADYYFRRGRAFHMIEMTPGEIFISLAN